MKLGILREEKKPLDSRVPLTPDQCVFLMNKFPEIKIFVRSSGHRCFSDNDYKKLGLEVVEELDHCDVLLGIKEVPVESLIRNKTYLFFSHTIKGQEYNRKLLKSLIINNIRMIDYEVLKNNRGSRIIGFGRYAGVVGAYNCFLTHGLKNKLYNLKPAYKCRDRVEMESELKKICLKNERIIITGKGRVSGGIIEIINKLGIKEVSKDEFITEKFDVPVFTNLDFMDYYIRIDGLKSTKKDFLKNPNQYKSIFMNFAANADILITGHYYDSNAPYIFTRDDAKSKNFSLKIISDISCDINGPIATTIRSSTIYRPIYGYNPITEKEDDFMKHNVIAVMAVDNLPCELPLDASFDFGNELVKNVIPLLIQDNNLIINNATICKNGKLNDNYLYLENLI